MAGYQLAQAYVQIVPSMKGVGKAIESAFAGPSKSVGMKAGQDAGGRFTAGLGARMGAVGGIAAAAAAKVVDVFAGLGSQITEASDSTQKFAQTLEFAKLSDKDIRRLTASTQDYANRTVYGIDDIRNTTAQLAANGVPNYDKLAEAAGNLNAVAGGNAETYKSVAMMLTQTAGAGKLTTENWNQLADAIPGASGRLQQAMLRNGAYTGNFRDAMAAGEITADEFNQALMQLGMDDTARKAAESTQTFEGAFGNLQATIVDGAANIVNTVKPALTGVVTFAGDKLQSFFGWFTKALQGAIDLIGKGDFTKAFADAFNVREDSPIVGTLLSARDTAIDVFTTVKQRAADFVTAFQNTGAVQSMAEVLGHVWDACKSLIDAVKSVYDNLGFLGGVMGDASGMGDLLGNAFKGAGKVVQVAADALKAISDWCSRNADAVTSALVGIGAAFAAFKVASLIGAVVSALQGFSLAATAAAAAQWALDAAMNANPIMLALTAITALAAGLVWFFTQTETGRKAWATFTSFLGSAMQAAGELLSGIWTWIVNMFRTAVTLIQGAWGVVAAWFQGVWNAIRNVFAPVADTLSGFFRNAWSLVSSIWQGASSWFQTHVWGPLQSGLNAIGAAFQSTKDWIARSWDQVKEAAAAPVRFVVDTVYNNGIKAVWDKVADAVGLDLHLPAAHFAFANGGVMPGYTPGRDVMMAAVSGGEAIMRPEFTRALGPKWVMWMNRLARTGGVRAVRAAVSGGMPAYAKGGIAGTVSGMASGAWTKVKDIAGDIADAVSSFLADPGGFVSSHILEPVKGMLGGVGGGMIGRIVAQAPVKWATALIDKARSLVNGMFGSASDAQAAGGQIAYQGGAGVEQWRGDVLKALAMLGQPASWAGTVLRRMNQESGGNPNAINLWDSNAAAGMPSQGLMQTIPSTFNAYAGPLRSRGITDPLANIYAGINYAIHRYGSIAGMNRAGGYSRGGIVPTLYDRGGWLPAGRTVVENRTGRPEPVLTRTQFDALSARPQVTQNFQVKVVRADDDLHTAASIIYRTASREARMLA